MTDGQLVIDADGHILEPPDLWERYLEPKHRDPAMRIKRDSEGWEYLEIAGQPSKFCTRGSLTRLGSMGREIDRMKERRELWKAGKIDKPFIGLSPDEGYTKDLAFGAMDPKERVQRLDQEGLSKAVIYPTIGIMWEPECPDLDLAYAYCRAYNRWIADFCRDSGGRLVPIAHISLANPARAVEELQRAFEDGCRGAFCIPFTLTRKPHGHPYHDPIFAALQDLDIPIGFHPAGTEPDDLTVHQRFDGMRGPARIWYSDMFVGQLRRCRLTPCLCTESSTSSPSCAWSCLNRAPAGSDGGWTVPTLCIKAPSSAVHCHCANRPRIISAGSASSRPTRTNRDWP